MKFISSGRAPRGVVAWIAKFSGLCLLALVWVSADARTPRSVKVTVLIESAQFRDGLGSARRGQIESGLAAELADKLMLQFPYMNWLPKATADPSVAELIVAVTERPTPILPEIKLEWRALIDDHQLRMRSIFPMLLYSSSNADRPLHDDRGEFQERLRKELNAWMESEPNREHLQEEFLRSVPLATSVAIPSGQNIVVIPVPWRQAQLDERSILRLSYIDSSGAPERTNVLVSGLARRFLDPLPGDTQSRAHNCTKAGEDIGAAELWARCVEPLTDLTTKKLLVKMDKYVHADPDVLDGMLLDAQ